MTTHHVPALNPTLPSKVQGSPPGEGHIRRAPPHTLGGLREPGAVKAAPSQGPACHQLEVASALAAGSSGLSPAPSPCSPSKSHASPNPQDSDSQSADSQSRRGPAGILLRHLLAGPPPSGLSSPICDQTDNTSRAVCQLGGRLACSKHSGEEGSPLCALRPLEASPQHLTLVRGRCFYCFMCLCPQLDHHLP